VARLTPRTVSAAVDPVTDAVRFTVPRRVFPNVNVTRPAGTLLPLACFTVAVSTVNPLCAIAAGFAVAVIVVPIAGAVTATVAVAVELLKVAVGV
jgi:hypothetical protein